MRGSSVASIGSVLAVATIHKLLLAVVAELARHLLEAGLHQGHVREGDTGAALFLDQGFGFVQNFRNDFCKPGFSQD